MKYVVVGGGTAGWLTALYLNKNFPNDSVTVVADSQLGILGAGEGTTPQFVEFIRRLDIPISDLFEKCSATMKLGIKFTNWNGDNDYYFHRFTNNGYALHFDASQLAEYFKSVALSRGVEYIDDNVQSIRTKDNRIDMLRMVRENISADFVFDCSGFKRLIIGGHYNIKWNDYSNTVPVKRAIAFQLPNEEYPPYTEAIAMKYGWIWKIPVRGRFGCGYVFDSDMTTTEEATKEIKKLFGNKVKILRTFDFNAGSYELCCVENCIAVGLSANFIEPLEATSIWTQVFALERFGQLHEGLLDGDKQTISKYNDDVKLMNEEILSFIYFHYMSERVDTDFWSNFTYNNQMPSRIKDLIGVIEPTEDYFDSLTIKHRSNYFANMSWLSVGEGIKYFNTDYVNVKVL